MEKGLRALFGQDEVFSEKIHKVKSHVSWLLKTSKITIEEYLDDEKRKAAKNHIQKLIMQVCRHFQGVFPYSVDANGVEFHADCHPLSRCKVDENYVNSSVCLINAGEAEKLKDFLENSDFMKNTDKFLLGKPTIYLCDIYKHSNYMLVWLFFYGNVRLKIAADVYIYDTCARFCGV